MAIQDDFSVAANGDIRYTGSTANYTVIDFHRWLGDLMDDAEASGNDILDITDATASERATDNLITLKSPYNIDDTAAQHLYDGSIVQDGGNTIYDGIVVIANQGMYLEIMQNGALITPNFWTTGLNADAGAGYSHRFMVKVRTGAADIDGRRLIGMTREWGYTYSEFKVNGTARGNNVMALNYSADLNNATASGTVDGWSTITNTEGYRAIDVNGDTVNEYYYSEWNRDTYTINQFYERMKYITRRGSSTIVYGLSGQIFRGITHEVAIGSPTGAFNPVEYVTWSGGTGQMLAVDSVSAGTKMWIQVLTGVAPTDTQVITGITGATATASGTATERVISTPWPGVSTGSAIIGSYGFGIEAADLSASDKLFDLTNTQRIPPNNVIFTVTGLVSGEDRILVGPDNTGLQVDQFTLSGTLTGGETTVTVGTTIPSDTPASGTIRVLGDNNVYARVTYTGYSGADFTGCGNVPAATTGNNVFISYIDKLADAGNAQFNCVYLADRTLFIRVRDGGIASPIKTYEGTGTLGSAGGSASINRTPDV